MDCDRCGKQNPQTITTSTFDTATLCMECKREEDEHPDYAMARDAEAAALKAGDMNFPGIGWPGKDGRA